MSFSEIDSPLAGLEVLPELEAYLPPASEWSDEELERQLVAEGGPREPITVWAEKQIVVDGHRRLKICRRHGLDHRCVSRSFADLQAVKQWMLELSLSRRNPTPQEQATCLVKLQRFLEEKLADEGVPEWGRQGKADRQAAEMANVTPRTIRRARQRAGEERQGGPAADVPQVTLYDEGAEAAARSIDGQGPGEESVLREAIELAQRKLGSLKRAIDEIEGVPTKRQVMLLLDQVGVILAEWGQGA